MEQIMTIDNINWKKKVDDLFRNQDKYHSYFYQYKHFGGPSLHFHRRSLYEQNDSLKIEMVYATLSSWGMHRMGGGATMNPFEVFSKSIIDAVDEIKRINDIEIEIINNRNAEELEKLFNTIKPMKSSVKVVGNSKVLAHYLPNIVCPIDREYTIQFLKKIGTKNIPPNSDFKIFKDFHNNLVYELMNRDSFCEQANEWIASNLFDWDTSLPKIIDNLIIGKILKEKGKV